MLIQVHVDNDIISSLVTHLDIVAIIVLFLLGVASFGLGAAGRTPWPPGGDIDKFGRNLLLVLGLIFMLVGTIWYKMRGDKIQDGIFDTKEGKDSTASSPPDKPISERPTPTTTAPIKINLEKYPQPYYNEFYTLLAGLKRSKLSPIKIEDASKYILKNTLIIEGSKPYLLIEFRKDSTLFTESSQFKLYFNQNNTAYFVSPDSAPEGWQPDINPPFYYYRSQTRYLHSFKMLLK